MENNQTFYKSYKVRKSYLGSDYESYQSTMAASLDSESQLNENYSGERLTAPSQLEKNLKFSRFDEHPEDNLKKYEFDGLSEGSDLDFMEELRVKEDGELPFTKRQIRKQIDFEIEFTQSRLGSEWDLKMKRENIRLFMRHNGSKVESSVHYTFTEIYLSKDFEMSKVVDAIFDVRKRLKWDKNIVTIRKFGKTANSWINY